MCPHHPQAMGPASAAEDLWRSNGDPWRIGPPTPTQGSSERPSVQPGPYLCSSTGLVTPTGRQPGDKESLAGSAPGHPTDPLSTSSSGDCSANSWHCSCPEQSAGCGFTALFLIHADQRKKISSPRLGERRCCKQPVPVTRRSQVGKPLALSQEVLSLVRCSARPVLSPTAAGRFFRPSSPALDKQVMQPRAVCAMGSGGSGAAGRLT